MKVLVGDGCLLLGMYRQARRRLASIGSRDCECHTVSHKALISSVSVNAQTSSTLCSVPY